MSESIPVDKIVFDESIFPRRELNMERVEDFRDAIADGAEFPAIELVDDGTQRIIDGAHRWHAYRAAGADSVQIFRTAVPDGSTPLLMAAERAAKQGQPLTRAERQDVTVRTVRDHPDIPAATIGRGLGVPQATVSRWTSALVQERKTLHRLQAVVLTRAGWTQQRVADLLGVSQQSITNFIQMDNPDIDLLSPAVEALPGGLGDDETIQAAAVALRDEVQEEADTAETARRYARSIGKCHDLWPYVRGVRGSKIRDRILAELDEPTAKWLHEIEEQIHA